VKFSQAHKQGLDSPGLTRQASARKAKLRAFVCSVVKFLALSPAGAFSPDSRSLVFARKPETGALAGASALAVAPKAKLRAFVPPCETSSVVEIPCPAAGRSLLAGQPLAGFHSQARKQCCPAVAFSLTAAPKAKLCAFVPPCETSSVVEIPRPVAGRSLLAGQPLAGFHSQARKQCCPAVAYSQSTSRSKTSCLGVRLSFRASPNREPPPPRFPPWRQPGRSRGQSCKYPHGRKIAGGKCGVPLRPRPCCR